MKTMILLTLLLSIAAQAETGSPEWRLRKLSLHLRGTTPTLVEYEAAKTAVAAGTGEAFFAARAAEYVKSAGHVAQMDDRLNELFRFKASEVQGEKYFKDIVTEQSIPMNVMNTAVGYESYSPLQAANGVFRSLTQENLSWDTLLLGTHYRAFPYPGYVNGYPTSDYSQGSSPDLNFLSNLLANDEMTKTEFRELGKLALTPANAEDVRLAGVVTTSRFFNRYVNTTTNKNRRRAAAIFSIFLCDDMRAVSVPGETDDRRFVDLALGTMTAGHGVATGNAETRHGSDPACASCHYKLDPLASLFTGFGSTLPPDATHGALVYKLFGTDGAVEKSVNVPVNGMRELGAAIVAQPEYAKCQVKHFWNWYIGSDVTLSPAREAEMIALFNAKERKVNDFVVALVSQPEFYTPPTNNAAGVMAYQKAAKVLKECTSCHVTSADAPKTSLESFPIGGTAESHVKWIKRIARVMDIANGGTTATMPPASIGLEPTAVKTMNSTIRSWLCLGAPDANGVATAKEFGATLCE